MAAESSLALGLISGTSADGIDACVVKITCKDDGTISKLDVVGFDTYEYPEGLKQKIFELSESGAVQEICLYNVLLGKLFAEAAKRVCVKCGVMLESVRVIGSHGQTIHHLPCPQSLFGHQVAATLQIGDPSVIANECGVTTVGDFRVADMCVGGQGAPLVPYLDKILLKKYHQDTGRHGALLNIGGISNISVYIPNEDKMIGFDCGPGNMVVDGLMEQMFGEPFDESGTHAVQGKVCQDLLQHFLKDGYYSKPPPKSTGREVYGKAFVKLFMEEGAKYTLSTNDLVATATELTVQTVCVNYDLHIRPLLRGQDNSRAVLFVSGGGVHNDYLMRRLKELLVECDVDTSMNFNIDPNAKEAVCFALMAYQTLKGVATNIPDVTGASRPVILGKICPVIT